MIANFKPRYLYFILATSAVLTLVLLYIYIQKPESDNTIFNNTYIDGVAVGGKTKAEAEASVSQKYGYLNHEVIEVIFKEKPVATFSAQELGLERDVEQVVDHAYLIGRTPHLPSKIFQQLNSLIHIRDFNFYTSIRYDKKPIEEFIAEMEETYNKPAKNATFTFENGKVTVFKSHEDGTKIKTDEFKVALNSQIQELGPNKPIVTVPITVDILKPEITLSQANNYGIEELIGEGQSDYSHSIASRIHNVKLAASKFNGVIIPKGETFSFNKTVGDISASTGYQQAYVISAGRTVLGDGGGVCQVSTTMFRAALNSGLPITERHAHAYRVGYYENDAKAGFDATIYSPSVDLQFKNDTQAAILIQMEIENDKNILRFKFYGKKDNRKVEISDATVWGAIPPPEPLYQDDPTLPAGVVKQVDFAAWGSKAKFDYKVTKEDGEVFQKEFYSAYRPWQAVFLKGTQG